MVGIAVEDQDTLKRFKAETKAPFPLLSDPGGTVSKEYAGLIPIVKMAKRANIVVGEDGIVKEVVTGGDAVDPSAAIAACPLRKAAGR